MEEKYNVSLLAAGMHREAQLLIAEVIEKESITVFKRLKQFDSIWFCRVLVWCGNRTSSIRTSSV